MSSARVKAAELYVLETYDRARELAGHDYGSGQRAAELVRRRRELERTARSGDPIPVVIGDFLPFEQHELADAFERVGRPRLRRVAELEAWRSDTPASRRTLKVWRALERRFTPRPITVDELEGRP